MLKRILFLFAAVFSFYSTAIPAAVVVQTLSIIKPDAVANKHIGEILTRFEKNGLRIAALKMTKLSPDQAEQFYIIHKERPFYKDLISYMSSGPSVIMVLSGPDAISKSREIMGATDPKKAAKGTIRADFGTSIQENAVHGSDSEENATKEIAFFFDKEDIFPIRDSK